MTCAKAAVRCLFTYSWSGYSVQLAFCSSGVTSLGPRGSGATMLQRISSVRIGPILLRYGTRAAVVVLDGAS